MTADRHGIDRADVAWPNLAAPGGDEPHGGRRPGREATLVELVDEDGAARGATTVDLAHRHPGLLHRAFSVLLLDRHGRILLQRRAAAKTRFALRWANTCCGHPAPGEQVAAAAARRLVEELGVDGVQLAEAGVYRYRATDPTSGRVEHEYDHVLFAEFPAGRRLRPDPDEVAEVYWSRHERLMRDLATRPDRYAPWLAGVVATWHSAHAPRTSAS
jgi:isopentenyl-diphosphate delta-isomerase